MRTSLEKGDTNAIMDETTNTLLLLATRIHHALLRHLGSGIDVGAMLAREGYAREVLYVCEGCGDAELKALGEQFKRLRGPVPAVRVAPPEPSLEAPDSGFDEDDDTTQATQAPASRWSRLKRWMRQRR
jgi:hypothetical protein